jgi:hypothetical protein
LLCLSCPFYFQSTLLSRFNIGAYLGKKKGK